MNWTYSGDPTSSLRDEVRFLYGDTDPGDPLLSDEELAYLIAANVEPFPTASAAATRLAAHFARKAQEETLGRRREKYGDRAKAFRDLAEELLAGPGSTGLIAASPRAPQIRKSTRDAAANDPDRAPTTFETGMMTNTNG